MSRKLSHRLLHSRSRASECPSSVIGHTSKEDVVLQDECNIGESVSGSYVGFPGEELSYYQYKVARYARKRWLRSEVILKISDPESIIGLMYVGTKIIMYELKEIENLGESLENSELFLNNEKVYSYKKLVSGTVQGWFRTALRDRDIPHSGDGLLDIPFIQVNVRRKYFNF